MSTLWHFHRLVCDTRPDIKRQKLTWERLGRIYSVHRFTVSQPSREPPKSKARIIFNRSHANVDFKRKQSPAAILKNGVPNIVVDILERQRIHVNQIRSDQIRWNPTFALTATRFGCELIAWIPFESLIALGFVVSFLQSGPDSLITPVDPSKISGLRWRP